mmetsp:Transcript_95046/g.268449  ORF Transcript_95046/g.268449 Transcript_95046/m.268449 type:complete len:214 (-) Transcript_95046:10-651(-)
MPQRFKWSGAATPQVRAEELLVQAVGEMVPPRCAEEDVVVRELAVRARRRHRPRRCVARRDAEGLRLVHEQRRLPLHHRPVGLHGHGREGLLQERLALRDRGPPLSATLAAVDRVVGEGHPANTVESQLKLRCLGRALLLLEVLPECFVELLAGDVAVSVGIEDVEDLPVKVHVGGRHGSGQPKACCLGAARRAPSHPRRRILAQQMWREKRL